MGVSSTRPDPKRSCSPRVIVKIPPPAPTSMPISTTRSSASMASVKPWLMASEYRVSARTNEHMRVCLLGDWDSCGPRERDRRLDAFRCCGTYRRALLFRCDTAGDKFSLGQDQRVPGTPEFGFLCRLVRLAVALLVAVPAVCDRLDQDRPVPRAAGCSCIAGRGVHGRDVVPIDLNRCDAVAAPGAISD